MKTQSPLSYLTPTNKVPNQSSQLSSYLLDQLTIQPPSKSQSSLIQCLINIINKKFSSLSMIIDSTIEKKILRYKKGWIQYQFLSKSCQVRRVFKQYNVPNHSRRRRNLLNKAIRASIVKRNNRFLKNKQYINVNRQAGKVIYFQNTSLKNIYKTKNCPLNQLNQSNQSNSLGQSSYQNKFNLLNTPNSNFQLTYHLIKRLLETIQQKYHNKKDQNKMQIEQIQQQPRQDNFYFQIQGDFTQQNQIKHGLQKQYNQNKPYRWCFIYLKNCTQQQVQQILNIINRQISINNLFIQHQHKSQYSSKFQFVGLYNKINVLSLRSLINIHYPNYKKVCRQLSGHQQITLSDKKKIQLKNIQLKQKQKLFYLSNLGTKIDLANDYHSKIHVQKAKQDFFKQRQSKKIEKQKRKLNRQTNIIQGREKQQNLLKNNQSIIQQEIKENAEQYNREQLYNQQVNVFAAEEGYQQNIIQVQQEQYSPQTEIKPKKKKSKSKSKSSVKTKNIRQSISILEQRTRSKRHKFNANQQIVQKSSSNVIQNKRGSEKRSERRSERRSEKQNDLSQSKTANYNLRRNTRSKGSYTKMVSYMEDQNKQ